MIRRHVLQIAIGLVLGALGSSAALGGAVTAHLNNAGSMTEHNVTVVPGETFSVDINVHNSSPIFCLLDLRLQASAGGVLAVVGGDIDGGDVDPLSKPFEWSLPFPQMLPAGDWTLGTVQILVDGQAAPGVYALSAVDGKYMDCRVCPAFGFVRSGPSLTVNVPPMMVLSDPPNCAIDARQPSEPDGSNSAGWQSVSITLSGDATSLTPDDFSVRAYPGPLTTTAIDAVYPTADPRTVQLELSAPMPLGQWTCITHEGSGLEVCVGRLPGDVNGDGTTMPADILALIDHLNGEVQPPYPIWQCDIDRSEACGPGDILRVIDLLNGADVYDVWLGRALPVCPTK